MEAEEKRGELRLLAEFVVMEMLKGWPIVMLGGALRKRPGGLPAEVELSTETMSRSWFVGRSGSCSGLMSIEGMISPFSAIEVLHIEWPSFWAAELLVVDDNEEDEGEERGEKPNDSRRDCMHLGLCTSEQRTVSLYISVDVVTSLWDNKQVSSSAASFNSTGF